jgi:hypothetical protein
LFLGLPGIREQVSGFGKISPALLQSHVTRRSKLEAVVIFSSSIRSLGLRHCLLVSLFDFAHGKSQMAFWAATAEAIDRRETKHGV